MPETKDTHRYEIPRKASIGITGIIALSTVAGSASDTVRAICAVGIVVVALVGLTLQFNSEKQKEKNDDREGNRTAGGTGCHQGQRTVSENCGKDD